MAESDNLQAESRGESTCCCSADGRLTDLALTCAEQAGPNLEIQCFALSASRTSGCAQNDKHDCHSKQETEVILAPVVVHFVHLHILVDE